MLILHVDDDSDDREIFCDAVKTIDSQISCIQHESGREAIDFLINAETLPDFMFIDINMPRMNGYECVAKIRSLPHLKNIQLVMYSTTFNERDLFEFSSQGILHLIKSSSFPEIVASIKGLICDQVPVLVEESRKTFNSVYLPVSRLIPRPCICR